MATTGSSGVTVVTGVISTTPFEPISKQDVYTTDTDRNDEYVVPTDKKWVIRHIHTSRGISGTILVYVNDGTSEKVYSRLAATTAHDFELELMITAGQSIKVQFGAAASGWMNSVIYYEETAL